ncbi:MAG: hypothetical protein ACJATF_002156, partial [Flavobacteriales bacterium]
KRKQPKSSRLLKMRSVFSKYIIAESYKYKFYPRLLRMSELIIVIKFSFLKTKFAIGRNKLKPSVIRY